MTENSLATGTEAAALYDAAAARARDLDTAEVRAILSAPQGRYKWPRHRLNEVELEWRRWRIRHHLGYADAPPTAILMFERLAAAAGTPAAAVSTLVDGGPLLGLSYDEMFPQGPLIVRAVKSRVVRRPTDHDLDGEYLSLLSESAKRRSDYLSLLTTADPWWRIPDLVSAATARACAKDVEVLMDAPRGEAYSGGPQPGWDIEHDALVSDSRNMYLGAGPTLIDVHEDQALIDLVSAKMGRQMHPTRCTYLNYRDGDYLGVHTDQPTCEVSLLFTIDGAPGPLRSYLDETAEEPTWLDRWVRTEGNFPDGGRDFVYEPREGLVLTGRAVPHARLPQTEPTVIGALFYSGLT